MASWQKLLRSQERRFRRLHRPARLYRLIRRRIYLEWLASSSGRAPDIHAAALRARFGNDRPRLP